MPAPKRSSLFAVQTAAPAAAPGGEGALVAAHAPGPVLVQHAPPDARKYPVAATRRGKRVASVYLEPEAQKQLHLIAVHEGQTIQDLLIEGVNAVFAARGQSRIA